MSVYSLVLFFGYPRCCIKQFCETRCAETKRTYPRGPWMGTGYIPCLSCAAEAQKDFPAFVLKNISPYRLFTQPFPKDYDGMEIEVFFEQIKQQI
jgi:hypothetical protein